MSSAARTLRVDGGAPGGAAPVASGAHGPRQAVRRTRSQEFAKGASQAPWRLPALHRPAQAGKWSSQSSDALICAARAILPARARISPVIPTKAGIQNPEVLDSRVRGNEQNESYAGNRPSSVAASGFCVIVHVSGPGARSESDAKLSDKRRSCAVIRPSINPVSARRHTG